jgi:hypothetical protein
VALLAPLIPYGIALAILAGLWGTHKVEVALAHHRGVNEGEATIQSKWDADKAQKAAAIAALASAWDAERQRADEASRQLEGERRAAFTALAASARNLPAADARIRVPESAVRVLDDAVAAANRGLAGPAGDAARAAAGSAEGAVRADPGKGAADGRAAAENDGSTSVGMLTSWGVGAAELYRSCRDRVGALITFYDGLRAAQAKESRP